MIPFRSLSPAFLSSSACLASLGVILVGFSFGCAGQRPLPRVLEDARHSMTQGKYDQSTKDFEVYVVRRPEEHAVRYEYGRSLLASGRALDAEKQFKIAIDVVPTNDTYLDARAEALLAAGERDELTTFLARTTSERGRVSDFVRQGKFAALMGHPDEAKDAFLTAAKLDGGRSFSVQWELAKFFGSVGDKANHVRRLRMAYFIDSSNQELLAAIRKAGEISGPSFALMPAEFVPPMPASTPAPGSK